MQLSLQVVYTRARLTLTYEIAILRATLFLHRPNQTTDGYQRGAELLYGERKRLSGAGALENSTHAMEVESSGGDHLSHTSGSTRSLTDEERLRLKDRYSMEYGRYLAVPSQ